jgi:hypothetical protein
MPRRRTALLGVVIESLEGRALLSALTPTRSAPFGVPDASLSAVDVSAAAERQADLFSQAQPSSSQATDKARSLRSGAGTGATLSSTARESSEPTAALRHSNSQAGAARGLLDPLPSGLKSGNTQLAAVDDDDFANLLGSTPGLFGAASLDAPGAASVVGWAPGAAAVVSISLADPPGLASAIDGRMAAAIKGSSVAGRSVGPFASVASGPEFSGAVPGDTGPPQLSLSALALAAEAKAHTWGNLLEGALRSDWEAVDGELRRFLSRLGGLVEPPNGDRSEASWPLCLGAAAVLFVARTAARGPRRFFRQLAGGSSWESRRQQVPVGPWPLGPP